MINDAHVKGDYYTTIHLYVPPNIIERDLIKRCYRTLHSLVLESHNDSKIDILNPNLFHISLSKGVNLRYHFIDPFISAVSNVINKFNSFPIALDTNIINVYANEKKSKYFTGIGVANLSAKSKIQGLLDQLDNAVEQFGFSLYKGTPHVSITSTECDLANIMNSIYPDHNSLLWPNIEELWDNKASLSALNEEELDKIVSNSLNLIEDDDFGFESCIVDYGGDIASFTANSVVVTVGARITRINLR